MWLPLRLRWEGGETLAVTYDVSDKGVLALAATAVAVGALLTVTFDVPGDPPHERTGAGRVVRAGPNEDDPHGLWPFRVAVALDAPLEAFAVELQSLARTHPGTMGAPPGAPQVGGPSSAPKPPRRP